ncbi:MAG: hypothetical protein RI907_968, partial [Pseudomonadota bacterium]
CATGPRPTSHRPLGLAALLLHERVNAQMLMVALAAMACVAGARRFA